MSQRKDAIQIFYEPFRRFAENQATLKPFFTGASSRLGAAPA